MTKPAFDCVVVGSGNAGSCAAIAAKDAGCRTVLIIDKCPASWVGGNGYFTAGATRTVHGGLPDLLPLVHNVPASSDLASKIDIDPYSLGDFTDDIMRLGDSKPDAGLVNTLVENSREGVQWLADRIKVPFTFSFNRQAYVVDGRQKFWGGLALSMEQGGKGLIEAHQKALVEAGVEMWFDSCASEIIREGGRIKGLVVESKGERLVVDTPSVILACGGFEASRDLRAKHLGDHWRYAKVRGTPYNTGDGLDLATHVGARLLGDFTSCHSTCWDFLAPSDTGDRTLSNQYTKSGYPLGLMLNAHGKRFVDEGRDFRNFTYAEYGKETLKQPDGVAWQVWDSKGTDLLRVEEYGDGITRKIWANSLEELGEKLESDGLESRETFLQTITEYNAAVQAFHLQHPSQVFNPAIKDGLSTQSGQMSLSVPKSNWALRIDTPPYLAVKVTCGITFTFGGLAIDPNTAAVLDNDGTAIPGLFCTGELVGGLFYNNYPGGSGLIAGCVFGRKAGKEASKLVSR